MTVSVIAPGITTFQDGGRPGFADVGVASAGAFDARRYRLVSALLAQEDAPALEVLAGNLVLEGGNEAAQIAVVGGAVHGGESLWPSDTVLELSPGERISVSPAGHGPAYVGISGLEVPPTLHSASFDSLSQLGPPPLRAGDILRTNGHYPRRIGTFVRPGCHQDAAADVLRVIAGPHWSQAVSEARWTVSSVARSGVRLAADASSVLRPTGGGSLPSFPVQPGCIQLPPSGDPIILGPDSGVTGGYPVAASVISHDLPLIARLAHGDVITFRPVTAEEAKTVWDEGQRRMANPVVVTAHL